MQLSTPVSSIVGIGPAYALRLEKLGIHTVEDLLYYPPFRYEDLSLTGTIQTLQPGETVTLTGMIMEIKNIHTKSGKTLQKAIFSDGSGTLDVTWFNQPYLEKSFKLHPEISLSGKVSLFRNRLSMTSPQHEIIRNLDKTPLHTGRLVSMYHVTSGLSSKWLRSRLSTILKHVEIVDILHDSAVHHNLVKLPVAFKGLHFPENAGEYQQARQRLAFDELLYLQLASQWRKQEWSEHALAHQLTVDPYKVSAFLSTLPFTLTKAQLNSLNEVIADLNSGKPMNRLLQGDVGSGKTVIAAAAMYLTAMNRLPSVLMAPTEILALQHAETIQKLVAPFGMTVSVQTGSRKDPLNNALLIVGTHAVLHRQLPEKLGFLVIDEQHRFGVRQRMQLLEQTTLPHVLSMTATPIPRTIALSLYSELNISVIDEMPKGRQKVKTWVVPETKRQAAYSWIKSQVETHNTQVFVICPFVQESENALLDEVKAVESEFEHLSQSLTPLKICMLHGRLKTKVKSELMEAFKNHEYDVMLATPVIEVGIDIPNAAIIMIESAERFGLAGLHQLRGRVGRGVAQSYCLLFTTKNQEVVRLKHMENVHSGFKLAELDLELRGPGDLYGTRQSGYIDLKFGSLSDTELITTTHQEAKKLLTQDKTLANNPTLMSKIKAILANQTSPH
jgi:ATP-dependent DNA helicase RecG